MKKNVDNCFLYEIRFDGVNFPANSPVMQKKTVKWESSTEKKYVRDGVLCCWKEVAITDVTSKLLTSKFFVFIMRLGYWWLAVRRHE